MPESAVRPPGLSVASRSPSSSVRPSGFGSSSSSGSEAAGLASTSVRRCAPSPQPAGRGPCWQRGEDLQELFDRTEIGRHLRNGLVMGMQHDAIAGSFEPLHRFDEEIAGSGLDYVLRPSAAISAEAVAVFGPRPFCCP